MDYFAFILCILHNKFIRRVNSLYNKIENESQDDNYIYIYLNAIELYEIQDELVICCIIKDKKF